MERIQIFKLSNGEIIEDEEMLAKKKIILESEIDKFSDKYYCKPVQIEV